MRWINIQGFGDKYSVSDTGLVKCKKSRIRPKKNYELMMKFGKDKDGYLSVTFCHNGQYKKWRINQLVGFYFVPNPKSLPIANHIDKDKTNNNYWNIEWTTVRENTCHAINNAIGSSTVKGWGKCRSRISIDGKSIHLGYFNSPKEANEAYIKALDKYKIENKYAK